jgi:hypothetical protein
LIYTLLALTSNTAHIRIIFLVEFSFFITKLLTTILDYPLTEFSALDVLTSGYTAISSLDVHD